MLISGGVKRRRLTGTGRPRDEERAGRAQEDLRQLRLHVVGQAEIRERRDLLRLVDETHDDRLALDRRQDRDADVHHAPGSLRIQCDAAVLRLAALGDVELRQNLEARRHPRRETLRDALHLVQHAVDAQPDDERVVLRLPVDVRGAVLGGLEDHRVDEADERRVRDAVVGFEVVGLVDLFLVGGLLLFEDGARAECFGGTDDAADLRLDVVARRNGELDGEPRRDAQFVDPVDVAGVCDRDAQGRRVHRERDRADALEHVQRHLLSRLRVDTGIGQVDERQLVAGGERPGDPLARCDPLVDERLCDRPVRTRAAARERQLVLGDEPGRGEQVGDELGGGVHARRVGTAEPAAGGGRGLLLALRRDGTELEIVGHIPRSRYRQKVPGP